MSMPMSPLPPNSAMMPQQPLPQEPQAMPNGLQPQMTPESAQAQTPPPDYDTAIKAILAGIEGLLQQGGSESIAVPVMSQAVVHLAQAASQLAKASQEEGLHTAKTEEIRLMGQYQQNQFDTIDRIQQLEQAHQKHQMEMMQALHNMQLARENQAHQQLLNSQNQEHTQNLAQQGQEHQQMLDEAQVINSMQNQGETPTTQQAGSAAE